MDEKTFVIRFSLSADIPEVLREDEDFDAEAWRQEWEAGVKPGLLRVIFAHLRAFPGWAAHIRNRGLPPADEIEIVARRRYETPPIQ